MPIVKVTIGSIWNPEDTVIVDTMMKPLKERVLADERDVDGHFRRLTLSFE